MPRETSSSSSSKEVQEREHSQDSQSPSRRSLREIRTAGTSSDSMPPLTEEAQRRLLLAGLWKRTVEETGERQSRLEDPSPGTNPGGEMSNFRETSLSDSSPHTPEVHSLGATAFEADLDNVFAQREQEQEHDSNFRGSNPSNRPPHTPEAHSLGATAFENDLDNVFAQREQERVILRTRAQGLRINAWKSRVEQGTPASPSPRELPASPSARSERPPSPDRGVYLSKMRGEGDSRPPYDNLIRLQSDIAREHSLLRNALSRPGEDLTEEQLRAAETRLSNALSELQAIRNIIQSVPGSDLQGTERSQTSPKESDGSNLDESSAAGR